MPKIKLRKALFKFLVIAALIATAFWLAREAQESALVQEFAAGYGYAGAFFISVLSGFNLAVPIPAISFLPLFLESGLEFWAVIVIITAGMTLADSIAYLIGKTGRQLIGSSTEQKALSRLEKMRAGHYWAPVIALFFFAGLVPLPNEIVVIPLGFLGYRLAYLLPSIFLGNGIFNLLSAAGIINLFKLF